MTETDLTQRCKSCLEPTDDPQYVWSTPGAVLFGDTGIFRRHPDTVLCPACVQRLVTAGRSLMIASERDLRNALQGIGTLTVESANV